VELKKRKQFAFKTFALLEYYSAFFVYRRR